MRSISTLHCLSRGIVMSNKLRLIFIYNPSSLNQIKRLTAIFTLEDMLPTFMKQRIPGVHRNSQPCSLHIPTLLDKHILFIQPSLDNRGHVVFQREWPSSRDLLKILHHLQGRANFNLVNDLQVILPMLPFVGIAIITDPTEIVNMRIVSINIWHRRVLSFIYPVKNILRTALPFDLADLFKCLNPAPLWQLPNRFEEFLIKGIVYAHAVNSLENGECFKLWQFAHKI